MDAVDPTYEITVPVEGGHDEAVAIAIAFEDWYAAHKHEIRYPFGDRQGQAFGDRAPRHGAIALRPMETIARGLGLRQLPLRRLLVRRATA